LPALPADVRIARDPDISGKRRQWLIGPGDDDQLGDSGKQPSRGPLQQNALAEGQIGFRSAHASTGAAAQENAGEIHDFLKRTTAGEKSPAVESRLLVDRP
jgi:hypothetical protein